MTEEMRNDLTPQGYIRQMFRETADGKLAITYYPFIGESETHTYDVNWTAEDAEQIASRYILLTNALARIGRLHDKMEGKEDWYKLLEEADLEVWNTYVKPYEPFEVELSVIDAIHERAQFGDLFEEEKELWKRFCIWEEEQSQKRIPFDRRSSIDLIQAARRYEKAVCLNTPEVVLTEQGRCLAEEMVLYYFGKEEPIVWD